MQYGIAFTPLVPSLVLWIAIGSIVVIAGLLLLARPRGAAVRVAALALIALALANPSFTREDREPLSSVVAVVVDKSPSQNFGDRTKQTAQAQEALVNSLKKIKGLEVRVVDAGQADGETDGTHLFGALSSALSDVPIDRVAGAFLITDGRVHDIPANATALGFQAPLHALISGVQGERDRRIAISAAPRFGIVGQTQTITYRLDDQGVTGQRAKITVRRDGEVISERTLSSGQTSSVDIDIKHAGPNIVEIEASPLENELTLVNNRAVVSIDGVRDKLRVLLVSGEPHSGERTWRNLLKSDASVDLVHFTILRPPEKQDGTPINELSLIAFPTRELFQQKINEFQLIIFDRYARQGVLPIAYFDNITRYVRAGGAVLVSAGPDYASNTSIWRTPLDAVLPAEPVGVTEKPFYAHLSDAGKRHPVTRGPGRLEHRAAALEPVLPHRRHPQRGHAAGHDRRRRRAAAAVVAVRRRPRRAVVVRPYLAVGARLRRRRAASRSVAAGVALADEAARSRRRGVAVAGAGPRPRSGSPDHGGQRHAGDGDLALRRDARIDVERRRARRMARVDLPANELGLWQATDGTLKALINVGPTNPKEFSEVTSTTDMLKPLAQATGGDARRVVDGSSVDLPRIVPVRASSVFHGDGWLGVKMRDASVVRGVGVLPIFAGLIGLLLLLGAFAATWLREGR